MGTVCYEINGYSSSTSSLDLGLGHTCWVPLPWDNDVK